MKLEKAIEILKDPLLPPYLEENPDFIAALKLGVEALNRMIENRIHPSFHPDTKLPGED